MKEHTLMLSLLKIPTNISDFFTALHLMVEITIVDTTSYVHLGPTGRGFDLRIALKF